jgi:hypothetical protein
MVVKGVEACDRWERLDDADDAIRAAWSDGDGCVRAASASRVRACVCCVLRNGATRRPAFGTALWALCGCPLLAHSEIKFTHPVLAVAL